MTGLPAAGPWTPRRAFVALVAVVAITTNLAACGSSGAPGWTFHPQPSATMAAAASEPVVATCPPGSTPDEPGPVDQARPVIGYGNASAFDRRAVGVVAISDTGDGVETWTFDVCTNTWTQMHPNREPSSFEWAQLVYDVDSDATIGVSYPSDWASPGRVWAYDLQADTWTEKGVAPTDARIGAYDPLTGVVAGTVDLIKLWSYEVETDTWTPIHQANGPGYAEFTFDTSVDGVVAYAGGAAAPETWLLDIRTGTWSKSAAVTPAIVAGMGLPHTITYDEAAERTVIISNSGLAAYDATADRWEMVLGGEPGSVPDSMVYDPVNERLVGADSWTNGVSAFDLLTREWTVLLETDEGQPAPNSE